MKQSLAIGLFVAAMLSTNGVGARWTERYFGVGSADDRIAACADARVHAEGNSSNACTTRQGKRGDAAYTDCICSPLSEGGHVCNVNLKVSCDGPASTGERGLRQGGEPKGRTDRHQKSGRGPRSFGRSGLEVRP
jgi:hypothetical protein